MGISDVQTGFFQVLKALIYIKPRSFLSFAELNRFKRRPRSVLRGQVSSFGISGNGKYAVRTAKNVNLH